MATKRTPMHIIREILRLKLVLRRSHREVARSLGVSAGKVGHVAKRAATLGLTWEDVEQLSDEALDERLHGPRVTERTRPAPDPVWIHTELRRPGVTLELLHLEYLQQHPDDGYRYTAFCEHYKRWRDRQSPVMRQVLPRRLIDGGARSLIDGHRRSCTAAAGLAMAIAQGDRVRA